MNVLVTGGAGYIGSQTCKELRKQGFTPIVLDSLVCGHQWAVQWGPLVIGNINESELVKKTIKKFDIGAVIHFAGSTYVGESVSNPSKYYENNVINSLKLFETLKETSVNKIVFSSTAAVYGIPEILPIPEAAPLNPVNPYGETKRIVEGILKNYQCFGFQSIALRYFNACGASTDTEIGEDHAPESHLIPLAIQAALDPDYVLQIYGTDYQTPDGTCIRDYIHVEDIAIAHVLALKKLLNIEKEIPFFETYNLGAAKGYSVKEVIKGVEQVLDAEVKAIISQRRTGDPGSLVASNEKAKMDFGWTPTNSSLENIIKTAVKWHTKHHYPQTKIKS